MAFNTDQESLTQRLSKLGCSTEHTYYVWIEDGNFMLLNGAKQSETIQSILLPSALQIAFLVNTADNEERREAARDQIANMYNFLTQSVLELDRAEEKEAKKKKQKQKTKEMKTKQKCESPQTKPASSSSWIPMTPVSHDYDTKTCECYQYEVTGDCWCEMW